MRDTAYSGRFPNELAATLGLSRNRAQQAAAFDGARASPPLPGPRAPPPSGSAPNTSRLVEPTVTTEEWALVSAPRGRPSELYHLGDDPQQTRNVLPEHPDVARELHGRLLRFLETAGGSGATARASPPSRGTSPAAGRSRASGVGGGHDPLLRRGRPGRHPLLRPRRPGRGACSARGRLRSGVPPGAGGRPAPAPATGAGLLAHPVRLALRPPLSRPPLARPPAPPATTSGKDSSRGPVRRAVQAFRRSVRSVADAARSCSTSANQPSSSDSRRPHPLRPLGARSWRS